MKKIIIVLLVSSMIGLSGCTIISDFIDSNNAFFVEGQKAITLAENFCFALSDDDLNVAEAYLHPDSPLKGESLCLFLMNFEQNNSIDFSNGISFRDRTMGESYNNSQNYEGYLPGRLHVFILYVLIDRQVIKIYFEVLSNDNGFGVYSFEKYVPGT